MLPLEDGLPYPGPGGICEIESKTPHAGACFCADRFQPGGTAAEQPEFQLRGPVREDFAEGPAQAA